MDPVMTTHFRGTDYSEKERIYLGHETAPDSSWWAEAPRDGFTDYARAVRAKRETTSHGRKRGPEFNLAMDRPIGE